MDESVVTDLNVILPHMGVCGLPNGDFATAITDDSGSKCLLGVGMAAYNEDISQTETVINQYEMWDYDFHVYDLPQRFGGRQCIEWPNGSIVPLLYDVNSRIVSMKIEAPTQQDLLSIPITWCNPQMDSASTELKIQTICRATQPLYTAQLNLPETQIAPTWVEKLGNPPNKLCAKTLENTTQELAALCESDNRDQPRLRLKPRTLAPYPHRLDGRTCTDTFFSSILSIKKYTCVQIF